MQGELNDRELICTRVLGVAPAMAFAVWTDPAHLAEWWGPGGFTTTTHAMDLRPGGEWRFTMHGPDGRDYANRVQFLEVEAPTRLVYRHLDDGEAEPVSFHATVTFAPLGAGTLLTMRMVFDGPEDLARTEEAYGASEGLLQTLTRLAEHVSSSGAATS